MLVDDEFGERAVAEAEMVLQFGGDLGIEGEDLELAEVVHGGTVCFPFFCSCREGEE